MTEPTDYKTRRALAMARLAEALDPQTPDEHRIVIWLAGRDMPGAADAIAAMVERRVDADNRHVADMARQLEKARMLPGQWRNRADGLFQPFGDNGATNGTADGYEAAADELDRALDRGPEGWGPPR